MKIITCYKCVPDEQDIAVNNADGSLDFSKADAKISQYDLNAIEAACQLKQQAAEAQVTALSVGGKALTNAKGRKDVLSRGPDELIVVIDDQFEQALPQQTRFRDLFNRRHFPFVLFVAAIWTCQVIPMFAIYTFGPQIVGLLGLGVGKNAALGNVVISLFFMLGCIPPMLWLNTAGRRPLLIGSFAMMTLALAVLGLIPDMGIWLVVMAFAVYAFFSGGPGNLQWLYPNELFPTDIRASAVGVIMSLSRIGTIVST